MFRDANLVSYAINGLSAISQIIDYKLFVLMWNRPFCCVKTWNVLSVCFPWKRDLVAPSGRRGRWPYFQKWKKKFLMEYRRAQLWRGLYIYSEKYYIVYCNSNSRTVSQKTPISHDDVIIIFRITGHLCGEFTGHRWIPRTKASDAELWCFLWSAPEYTVQ